MGAALYKAALFATFRPGKVSQNTSMELFTEAVRMRSIQNQRMIATLATEILRGTIGYLPSYIVTILHTFPFITPANS
jgi:hypothetical protein